MSRSFLLSIAGRVFLALIPAFSAGVSGDALLEMVPAESVLCVRVNNLDYALGMMDQYLAGTTPAPMGITMMARGQLAGILSDATLENVKTDGNFAVFGVFESSETEGMMGGFYGLIPMKDYAKFVSDNPNCGDADAKGVSQIKGVRNMGQEPMVLSLIKRVGNYALVTSANNYDGLVSTTDAMKGGKGLGGAIGGGEMLKAMKSPFWIHADIAQVSKLFGPMVYGKIDEIKAQLDSEEGAPPAEIMDIYVGLIKVLFEELASVNITLTPKADVANALIAVNAVPGSGAYKSFQGGGTSGINKLINYVEDGSMINMAARMDTPFWQQGYIDMMDMIGTLGGDAVKTEDLEKLKAAAAKSIGVTGSMMFTMSMGEKGGKPIMTIKEVVEVTDEKVYNEAVEEMLGLMNDGAISDLYKGFGIKISCTEASDAGTYKGISIKSARLGLEAVEPEEAFGKMIDGIYGGGFDYRWAVFDGRCVYAIGEEVDAGVRELIDSVKAGGPKSTCAEMQEAMRYLNTSDRADFLGTYNYVRLIKMMGPMMASMASAEPDAAQIGELLSGIEVDSTSNIAFAGSASGGTFEMEIALPKAHLMEMQQVFGAIQQKEMQMRQQQQPQQQ